jgi:Alw26I/Eco31I/Esp3I family type II restriction m6 adenine DNA methyltransferase
MDKSTLQQKLNQPYTTDNWREIVQYVFPNVQIFNPPQVIPVDNDKVETFRQLGNVILQDGKTLALFELKLKSNVNILRNRVELNTIVSQYIDQERTHGVLSIFEQGTDDYRFTFSAKATEFDEESGDFQTQKTDTKRYTYVLGRNESCKTPAARFADLADKKAQTNIQSIQDAFSVEKLSKEFFKEYKVHYLRMVDYLLTTDAYKRGTFHSDEKAVRDFVKLLMGRLVFIHFVQKKRWMGVPAYISGWHDGPVNFLYQGFLDFEYKETFYSAFLEPLFYDTFNTPNRSGDLFSVTGSKVPYLNGGLFEKGEMDTSLINFPEVYFADLLEFFDRYNFTIDENDPNEHEVGIDPEMLGHIFENLLEDNKDKGAFYTPKEIVHYMCQESLKEYLKTRLEAKGVWPAASDQATEMEQSLEAFVKRKEAAGIIDHDGILAQALRDVKICDPAIGSGAFPMGLLTEIFRCMFVLYHASPDTVGEIWGMEAWQPETVKKNIIQNSIYGVDIERGAVDIARLRFWLSLIVDEPEPHALPNLDYKIVVGNSLVSKLDDVVIDIDWSRKRRTSGDEEMVQSIQKGLKDLIKIQKMYFNSEDKDVLKLQIRKTKIGILLNQLKLDKEIYRQKNPYIYDNGLLSASQIKKNLEITLELKQFDNQVAKLDSLLKDETAPLIFFNWKLYFPEVMNEQVTENVGFDIVIGNPPYFQLREIEKKLQEEIKQSKYFEYAKGGRLNVYQFFVPLAILLTRDGGITCLITQNSILAEDTSISNRKFIFERTTPLGFYSFPERDNLKTRVFESAKMSVAISILLKSKKQENEPFKVIVWNDKNMSTSKTLITSINEISGLFSQKLIIPSANNSTFYFLKKIKSFKNSFNVKAQAGEIDMSKYKHEFILNNNYNTRVYTGAQILRYKITDNPSQGNVLYLPENKIPDTPKTRIRFSERIGMQRITGVDSRIRLISTLLPPNSLCANSTNFISGMSGKDLRYCLGVLNSKLINFYFKLTSTNTNITTTEINNIPIPKYTSFSIPSIVDILLYLHKNDKNTEMKYFIETFEEVIDALVFELYFPDEFEEKGLEIEKHAHSIFKPIEGLNQDDQAKVIHDIYQIIREKDNLLRNQIKLMKIELKELLLPILSI